MNNINYTVHALKRMSERKISKTDIQICIEYGKKIHRTGIKYYIILSKQVLEYGLSQRFNGLCILLSSDDTLITTFKNKDAFNYIKKLSKINMKKLKLKLA